MKRVVFGIYTGKTGTGLQISLLGVRGGDAGPELGVLPWRASSGMQPQWGSLQC